VESLVLIAPAGSPFQFPSGSGLLKIPGIGTSIFKAAQNEKQVMAQDFYDVEKSKEIVQWVSEQRKKVNIDVFCKSFVNSFKYQI
jgi:hypothetical protein